jgi:hypothetical protein
MDACVQHAKIRIAVEGERFPEGAGVYVVA